MLKIIFTKTIPMSTYYILSEEKDHSLTVKTRHKTMDWFKIGKGVHQGCILSPCLFNLYAKYIMLNARLNEAKLESILLGEINKLRYTDDTTLVAESKEELKSLLKVKEESEKKLA